MKRAREEVEEEEQEQEQEQAAPMDWSPSRNAGLAAAEQPSSETGEPREPTMDDGLAFVLSIKREFSRTKYHEFFSIIQQIDSIGVTGVMDRLKVLLRGHPDLIRHFNMFLPTKYKFSLTDDVDK